MDKIQTIKERIFIFIERKNISKQEFYNKTGISGSNFKGTALKSDLAVNKVSKIVAIYPELMEKKNLLWLVTGIGDLDINTKKDQHMDDLFFEEKNESLGDLLANIFAQNNIHDQSLQFIQNKFKDLEAKIAEGAAKQDKILETMQEILKNNKLISS